MRYRPGNMGVAEGLALVVILTFSRVFLSAPVWVIDQGGTLGWVAVSLDGLPALGALFIFCFIFKRIPGDLISVSRSLAGTWGAWLIALYYSGFFFANAASLIRQFAENTLVTALPHANFFLILAWYGLMAAIILYIGLEPLARATYLLLPFLVMALVLVLLMLLPDYNIYNLAPWQGTGLGRVALSSLAAAGTNTGIMALAILVLSFQQLQTVKQAGIFGLGISAFLKGSSIFIFTLVFGVETGREKLLPFYEMSRLVYLSRYVQRLESVFILVWVISGILSIAASLYLGIFLLARLFELPSLRPIIGVVTIIICELAAIPPDISQAIRLDEWLLTGYGNVGIYGIPVILLLLTVWKGRKGRDSSCIAD